MLSLVPIFLCSCSITISAPTSFPVCNTASTALLPVAQLCWMSNIYVMGAAVCVSFAVSSTWLTCCPLAAALAAILAGQAKAVAGCPSTLHAAHLGAMCTHNRPRSALQSLTGALVFGGDVVLRAEDSVAVALEHRVSPLAALARICFVCFGLPNGWFGGLGAETYFCEPSTSREPTVGEIRSNQTGSVAACMQGCLIRQLL